MQSLLTGYAVSYNLRHARAGKLYQNRFKSVLCEKEEYLLKLIQYIHLNPLRVGLIKDLKELDTSPLTGHSIIMGKTKKIHLSPHTEKEPIPVNWLDTEEVLSNFSRTKKKARIEYRKYIQQGIGEEQEDLSGGGLVRSLGGVWEAIRLTKKSKGLKEAADERILGTGEFVEEALKYAGEKESKASLLRRQGWDINTVRKKVCEILLIKPKSLYNRGQQDTVSQARALYSKWLSEDLGMRKSEIAEELGVSRAAMGRLVKRGEQVEKELGVSLLEA
jgi:hypothetical protein